MKKEEFNPVTRSYAEMSYHYQKQEYLSEFNELSDTIKSVKAESTTAFLSCAAVQEAQPYSSVHEISGIFVPQLNCCCTVINSGPIEKAHSQAVAWIGPTSKRSMAEEGLTENCLAHQGGLESIVEEKCIELNVFDENAAVFSSSASSEEDDDDDRSNSKLKYELMYLIALLLFLSRRVDSIFSFANLQL